MDPLTIASTVLQLVPTSWVVYTGLYLLVMYWLFVFSITAYQAYLNKKLSKWQIVALSPPIVVFAIMDVLFNYTLASLAFLELPKSKEYTLSDRLKRYNTESTSVWKRAVASLVCQQMLNVFVMTEDHC